MQQDRISAELLQRLALQPAIGDLDPATRAATSDDGDLGLLDNSIPTVNREG